MSIDIQIEAIATGTFTFECYEQDQVFGPFANHELALAAIDDHKATCQECDVYGCYTRAVLDVDESVNLANANAAHLFAEMGLELDPNGGSMAGEEFLGYVMVASAMADDSGLAPSRVGNFIDCGIRPGYKAEKFARLAEIATEAARLGREVIWY